MNVLVIQWAEQSLGNLLAKWRRYLGGLAVSRGAFLCVDGSLMRDCRPGCFRKIVSRRECRGWLVPGNRDRYIRNNGRLRRDVCVNEKMFVGNHARLYQRNSLDNWTVVFSWAMLVDYPENLLTDSIILHTKIFTVFAKKNSKTFVWYYVHLRQLRCFKKNILS